MFSNSWENRNSSRLPTKQTLVITNTSSRTIGKPRRNLLHSVRGAATFSSSVLITSKLFGTKGQYPSVTVR